MAPEQLRGEAADGRTDLCALGVVLYELVTGRRPFEGATTGVISSGILRDAPAPLGSLRKDVPADLERVVARCLEKEPRARFQTALDVAGELRLVRLNREAAAILKPPPVPSTPLLGREETLESAAGRLREGARVLTVTGYGGTGKTRFSIELFRRLAPAYAEGAAFVSLASVTAPAEVLPTVAIALDIPEARGRSALEALVTVIGDRRVLLVLDNLEQVLAAADAPAARRAFVLGVRANEEVGSGPGTGLALLGLAAVEAAEGRAERAVAIAAAASALSERAGVVIEHPMDPGLVARIDAVKASIPRETLDGLVAGASMLSVPAVLAMVGASDAPPE
jgi:hypothetical protein